MSEALASSPSDSRLRDWIARVEALVSELAQWSSDLGWKFERGKKVIHEKPLGPYEVPTLSISIGDGQIEIDPVGLQVIGADGRVDVKAYPTLSRVKLVGVPGGWTIVTDSNVPLRVPWTSESFAQLAGDLLAW